MRTLLIHFGQMGDAVMALPAAAAVRAHYGAEAVTVLAGGAGAEVFAMAGFSPVWRAERAAWKRQPWRAGMEIPRLLARIRRGRFELSIDLHSYKETNLLAWAAGIPERAAMLRPTRSWPRLINRRPPPDDTQGRLVDRYCAVLQAVGIAVEDRRPRLTPAAATSEALGRRLRRWAGEAGILGVCPGAGHASRRWPAERFAAVAQTMHDQRGAAVAVFAGPEEGEATLAPLRRAGAEILTGLTLAELAAALAHCRAVVTNATGPSHVAAAVGAKVVTLGEIPMFDPVGAVWAVRAAHVIGDITVEAATAAVRQAWD